MKQYKITLLTSIGSALEYYDLVIYSLLANFISKQFFPSTNQVTALFATFSIFALSYVARPLGGIILGIVGDWLGRKIIFTNTLLWMALVTFLMGLIPNYATWGITATILFSICRITQGLVFGAEMPGALTLLAEHIDSKHHGLHFGFMTAMVGLGVSLGSGVTWLLTTLLTEQELLAWGFRIPFLLGGSLASIGFIIRKYLPETPAFLKSQKTKPKITKTIIKNHLKPVMSVIGIFLFPACLVNFKAIFPAYLHNFYHFAFSDIYAAMTFSHMLSIIIMPTFGWLSDLIGKKALIIGGALLMVIFSYPAFALLQLGEPTGAAWRVFSFIMFIRIVIDIMAASYFVLLPLAFQTTIRYTGTAFSFNIVHTIAALLPLLVNYIYGVVKSPYYLIGMFILLATITIISTITFKINNPEP